MSFEPVARITPDGRPVMTRRPGSKPLPAGSILYAQTDPQRYGIRPHEDLDIGPQIEKAEALQERVQGLLKRVRWTIIASFVTLCGLLLVLILLGLRLQHLHGGPA